MALTREIPGVVYSGDGRGVLTTWDALPVVATRVEKEAPPPPESPLAGLPGYSKYEALIHESNLKPRPYQVEDAVWLANRHYALLANPMRSGKTLTTLLAAVLAGYERILVLCPSISKWVWGDECAKWLGEEALILEGLNYDRVVRYCATCKSSGRAPDGSRCPACKARNGSSHGYHIHQILETVEPKKREVKDGAVLLRCRKHPEVWARPGEARKCERCRDEMRDVLTSSKIVVANYEILTGHKARNVRGRVVKRADLPGWQKPLTELPFDLAIIDESHTLRGFDTSNRKRGNLLSDRIRKILHNVDTAWLVTGTPIFGIIRDLYGQLDAASGGLWGNPKEFTERYCAGHAGPHGWVARGRSNEDELKARLSTIMMARPRSEILKYMPAKVRRVVYIDNDKPVRRKASGGVQGHAAKLIDAVAPLKHDVVVENVLAELSEGLKVYVLTFRPKHAQRIADKLAKKMNSKQWRTRMNSVKGEVFLGQTEKGITPKTRRELAKSFCAHQGAAVFIATIRSMPGSVSLKGVSTVHMVDFDTVPSSMEQAEDRGYEPGIPGYSITHYVVRNSIDDDFANIVLPKFQTKDLMLDDENARNVLGAFDDNETLEEVMARHTAHLADTEDDDDDDWM